MCFNSRSRHVQHQHPRYICSPSFLYICFVTQVRILCNRSVGEFKRIISGEGPKSICGIEKSVGHPPFPKAFFEDDFPFSEVEMLGNFGGFPSVVWKTFSSFNVKHWHSQWAMTVSPLGSRRWCSMLKKGNESKYYQHITANCSCIHIWMHTYTYVYLFLLAFFFQEVSNRT